MSLSIDFSPEALADLIDLYDYIASRSGAANAIGYINSIETFCESLTTFPGRGTRRDDLRQGMRILGFERSAMIAIAVNENVVTILRILYGGRDVDNLLRN